MVDRIFEFPTSAVVIPPLDFARLLKDVPRGAWVAISGDEQRVLSNGLDVKKVLQDALAEGEEKPTILRVPETSTALIW